MPLRVRSRSGPSLSALPHGIGVPYFPQDSAEGVITVTRIVVATLRENYLEGLQDCGRPLPICSVITIVSQ